MSILGEASLPGRSGGLGTTGTLVEEMRTEGKLGREVGRRDRRECYGASISRAGSC